MPFGSYIQIHGKTFKDVKKTKSDWNTKYRCRKRQKDRHRKITDRNTNRHQEQIRTTIRIFNNSKISQETFSLNLCSVKYYFFCKITYPKWLWSWNPHFSTPNKSSCRNLAPQSKEVLFEFISYDFNFFLFKFNWEEMQTNICLGKGQLYRKFENGRKV